MKHLSFFVLFLGLQYSVAAQSILLSEAINIKNDYGYEIIGRLYDNYLVLRDKFGEYEVQAFNEKLRLHWSKELDDIGRKGTQLIAVVGGKNDFSVIFMLKNRGNYILRLHKYDPGANLIDTMTLKNYGLRNYDPPEIEVVRSEDNNCLVAYNKVFNNYLELTCFRLDKMQVLWDKSLYLDRRQEDWQNIRMALSNAGDFFYITEDNNRRNKLEEHRFNVHYIGRGDTAAVAIVPLPDFMTRDFAVTFDEKNHKLVGAGLFSDRNRDRSNGTFYFTLPPGATSAQVFAQNFEDRLISIVKGKEVVDDRRGIADASVRHLILREDGGVVLVGEINYFVQRGASATRGFWRDGIRMVIDYFYDDIFSVSIHPTGAAHWQTVLYKKQYSQDDDAAFSSFFLMRMADRIRLMFNDEIKYENTCSEYVVSPLGEFDRNSLMSTENQKMRLRFRDGVQISANECLIPSEYRSRLRLVLYRF